MPVHMSSTVRRPRYVLDPRREAVIEQLSDEGARDDHALVDIERKPLQPGLIQQICGGHALLDAPVDHLQQVVDLRMRQIRVGEELEPLGGSFSVRITMKAGLLEGIGLAVAEGKLRFVEAGHRVTQHIAQRAQLAWASIVHALFRRRAGARACRGRCPSAARGSASSMCSLILWMRRVDRTELDHLGADVEMKRPSDVPPVVESSGRDAGHLRGSRRAIALRERRRAASGTAAPPSVHASVYSRPWRASIASTRCCSDAAVDSVRSGS